MRKSKREELPMLSPRRIRRRVILLLVPAACMAFFVIGIGYDAQAEEGSNCTFTAQYWKVHHSPPIPNKDNYPNYGARYDLLFLHDLYHTDRQFNPTKKDHATCAQYCETAAHEAVRRIFSGVESEYERDPQKQASDPEHLQSARFLCVLEKRKASIVVFDRYVPI